MFDRFRRNIAAAECVGEDGGENAGEQAEQCARREDHEPQIGRRDRRLRRLDDADIRGLFGHHVLLQRAIVKGLRHGAKILVDQFALAVEPLQLEFFPGERLELLVELRQLRDIGVVARPRRL